MVDVTPWESYPVKLMYYLVNEKENGPIVMILTHAKCKRAGLPFDHNINPE